MPNSFKSNSLLLEFKPGESATITDDMAKEHDLTPSEVFRTNKYLNWLIGLGRGAEVRFNHKGQVYVKSTGGVGQ